jgi:hypothetical protein
MLCALAPSVLMKLSGASIEQLYVSEAIRVLNAERQAGGITHAHVAEVERGGCYLDFRRVVTHVQVVHAEHQGLVVAVEYKHDAHIRWFPYRVHRPLHIEPLIRVVLELELNCIQLEPSKEYSMS